MATGSGSSVDIRAWGTQPPLFITLLAREVEQSNRTLAGKRLGLSRTAVSLVLINRYPAATTAVEQRVLETLGRIQCTALGNAITAEQCQSHHQRKAPTHNPQAMQLWRACQHCANNPNCARRKERNHV
ncbi:hypothetical protein [Ectopseudomonas mendocina]|uniref:Uncharacterized protein n=1 Tax=Ectopseudomonas mendocina TaxID=300 RepID=A0A2R3QPH5_ECTME|nr:hypothetical protein [Pseudomonas mendocina]AVO53657.1 hypothetical protein C7A17_13055 [Pseudomonas mendocina]